MVITFIFKKTEAYHNAYTGTGIGCGPLFLTPPRCDHGLNGIVIAPEVKGGARILILHQVTLGYNIGGEKQGAPELGSNIMIGAGAKILGPIKIGNNVIIGSNSVITKNIPDNCTVVGNNRIIARKGQ